MRYFERQLGETEKAYAAFCVYRDQGAQRSTRKVAQELGKSIALIQQWSRKNDWVDRAEAYDGHLEMTRQSAIEEHEREKARDLVQRRNRVQEEVVELQEKALVRLREMSEHGITREQVVEEEYEDGRPKTIKNIYPARWSYNTIIKAIEVLDNTPDKLALTDPAGQHEWGKTREEMEEEFMQLVERARREGQGEE